MTPADLSAQALLPQVALGAVREGQAFEATVEQLATAVRIGALPVGNQLPPERELAAKLGVSRVTLREAIDVLRDLGMVETRRGRGGGSFVTFEWSTRPQPDDSLPHGAQLEDILGFRRVLEGGSAHLAASRRLPESDRRFLLACLDEVRAASAHVGTHDSLETDDARRADDPALRDESAHRQADSRLHLAVAAASGNTALVEALTRNRGQIHRLLCAIPVLPRNVEHSNADHAALIDAVLAGEPDDAREIAEEHCDKTAALLRGLIG